MARKTLSFEFVIQIAETHTQNNGRKEAAVKRIDQLGRNVLHWKDIL